MNQRLAQATQFLQEWGVPRAAALDEDPEALRDALKAMGDRHLLNLRVPQALGGAGFDQLAFHQFQETVARYSGALAFLQTQHQSAAAMLAGSENESLKQTYLPHLGNGQCLIGVGFSQLRRTPAPLQAIAVSGGYQLNGEIPWITGFGCFAEFIAGAALPDRQAVFGLLPFRDTLQEPGGAITFSPPLQLAAMASTNTVTALVRDWFLPQLQVLSVRPADWLQQRDRQNVLQHSFFALGCAQAGLDILNSIQGSSPAFVGETLAALQQELGTCRTAIYQADLKTSSFEQRLSLRAWAIDLAARCSHAAVVVSRGAANYSHHPAQRVYREALAFTVFGQTTAVMAATLTRLIRPAPRP